ncbi:mucoidy inhibitor MuiA family protein [Chitinophaga silvatica]|uniref:Mucoidy inhibitor MuiA family protein n=1 Tax=Chitinophaga silvatica TaxID=2282649 RepID=A0A3E1Y208_9BACT|nr:DUF4139 domain-containing protein [Chitinophaga silvatica]RFS18708.1 mucoidy inhibitor MuiA family protein [Chitinophaga silvatica]
MNKFIFLIAAYMPIAVIAQPKKQTVSTTISKVTVFIKGAQITRTGNVSLAAGNNQVTITDVSPDLEEKSIQVNGEGDFSLLSVSRQPNIIRQQTKRTEIANLEAQLEKLTLQLQKEQSNEEVYKEEKNMLVKNQAVGGNNGLKANDLKESLDLQRARLTEILAKLIEIKERIINTRKDILLVNEQLTALNNKANTATSDIILDINSKSPVNGKITVSYVVKNAGWIPFYDIRVKDINNPLTMLYKASVYQQCGEDWKDVKLALSTGTPDESNTKPTLQPWFLKYYSSIEDRNNAKTLVSSLSPGEVSGTVVDDEGHPLPGVSIQVKGRNYGAVTDANGSYKLQVPPGNNNLVFSYIGYERRELAANNMMKVKLTPQSTTLQEVVVSGYAADGEIVSALSGKVAGLNVTKKRQTFNAPEEIPEIATPTTITFDIPIPYSIPPDGKTYSVGIKELEIAANYQYYAVPKIEKAAFLTAAITDWESLNLLDGEASIFYEGTYIGKTLLDLQAGTDTLQISLGKDKQVIVNRTLLKDESKKNFMGSKTTFSKAWEISIRNNKKVPINITVQDQLPIKTSSDMEVSKAEYDDATIDNESKILNWVMKLAPAAEQKKRLKYAITYPKGSIVNAE